MSVQIDLEGKVAVVTGAGRGIGRAVALALADAGADVALAARTLSQLEQVAAEIRLKGRMCLVVPTDVSRKNEVDRLMSATAEKLGGLHILINNAATQAPGPLLEQTEADWERVMAVNVKAYFLCTQAAGKYMTKQKYGKIVNLASTGGVIAGPQNAAYHSSKAAIIHFTRSVALEWIKFNINVNAVGPGMVDTEFVDQFIQLGSRDPVLKIIPIRRFGDPAEIANLVVFLASDLASYIVGEHVVIDGGLTIP